MAEPKKKMTSTRSGNRKAHDNLKKMNLVACSKCKTMIKPHQVCYVCGFYGGKSVVDMKKKDKKKEKSTEEKNEKE